MIVLNGMERAPAGRPAVVTLGNYDGVHLGHRAILAAVVADARERGAWALLVTFEPHPAAIIAPRFAGRVPGRCFAARGGQRRGGCGRSAAGDLELGLSAGPFARHFRRWGFPFVEAEA